MLSTSNKLGGRYGVYALFEFIMILVLLLMRHVHWYQTHPTVKKCLLLSTDIRRMYQTNLYIGLRCVYCQKTFIYRCYIDQFKIYGGSFEIHNNTHSLLLHNFLIYLIELFDEIQITSIIKCLRNFRKIQITIICTAQHARIISRNNTKKVIIYQHSVLMKYTKS